MKSLIDGKRFTRWLRVLHRDLGFLAIGLCLIYAISGILLNHMDGSDPAYKVMKGSKTIEPGLSEKELTAEWAKETNFPAIKRFFSAGDSQIKILAEGGTAQYNRVTGELNYEFYLKRPFVYFINKLHYNQVKGWTFMADLFAVLLIFFALSGLVMVKGKKGLAGSGKWYLLAGLLIPLIYLFFV